MSFTTALLDTTAKCDVVLAAFAVEKGNAEFAAEIALRAKNTALTRSTRVKADIASMDAEIASLTTIITGLPTGKVKEEMEDRKRVLEYNKWRAESRSGVSYDALLDRELNHEVKVAEMDKIVAAITTITTHKATL